MKTETVLVTPCTPGEWHVVERNGKLEVAAFNETDEFPRALIADINDCELNPLEDHTAQVKANARLIAAAPELLVELRNLVLATSCYATWKPGGAVESSLITARDAIAKATGDQSTIHHPPSTPQ